MNYLAAGDAFVRFLKWNDIHDVEVRLQTFFPQMNQVPWSKFSIEQLQDIVDYVADSKDRQSPQSRRTLWASMALHANSWLKELVQQQEKKIKGRVKLEPRSRAPQRRQSRSSNGTQPASAPIDTHDGLHSSRTSGKIPAAINTSSAAEPNKATSKALEFHPASEIFPFRPKPTPSPIAPSHNVPSTPAARPLDHTPHQVVSLSHSQTQSPTAPHLTPSKEVTPTDLEGAQSAELQDSNIVKFLNSAKEKNPELWV